MIELTDIHLFYKQKELLKNGHIEGNRNEVILIKGKSGSGKTTLLYQLCLVGNMSCQYCWDHKRIDLANDTQKAVIRREKIGFVLQSKMLIEGLSVKENLSYYAQLNGITLSDKDIMDLLKISHLEGLKSRKVNDLSGGEKQRIAIMCAISKKPELLLLDEPTSQLDTVNEQIMMNWIKEIAEKFHICVMITSHRNLDDFVDKIYLLEDNQLKLKKDVGRPYIPCSVEKKSQHIHLFDVMKIQIKKDRLFYLKITLILWIVPLFTLAIQTALHNYCARQVNVFENSAQKEILNNDYQMERGLIEQDVEVNLLFYYPQNKMNQYIRQDFKKEGCYVSQALFQYLHRDLSDDTFSLEYQTEIIEIPIAGILNQNEIVKGTNNSLDIFIPIDVYQDLTKTNPVFFVDTIEELMHFDTSRIVFLNDAEVLKDYQKLFDYQKTMQLIIYIVFVLISILFSIIYCCFRRKEWALRYFDGFSKRQLFMISIFENSLILVFQAILMSIVLNTFVLFLEYGIFFHLISMLVMAVFIKKLDFKKIMRS